MVSILVAGSLLALRVESAKSVKSRKNLQPLNPESLDRDDDIKPCDLHTEKGKLYHDIVFEEGDEISYISKGISEIPELYSINRKDPQTGAIKRVSKTDTIKDLEYVRILIKREDEDPCTVNIGGILHASREAFPPPGHMWLWITAIKRPTRIIQQGETKKLDWHEKCVGFFNKLLSRGRRVQSLSEFVYLDLFLPDWTRTYTPHDVAQYLYSCGTMHPPRPSAPEDVQEEGASVTDEEIRPAEEELVSLRRANNKSKRKSFLSAISEERSPP